MAKKNNFARAAHFLVHFFCRCFARLQRETSTNFLVARFIEEMWYVYLIYLFFFFFTAAHFYLLVAATTSCKSAWDTVPYFGINGLSMILCLWSPLHPLSKLLAIQDHTQNLEEQLWMGGRREVSTISHRPVTRSDLKQEKSFFGRSASTFLQLVVAFLIFSLLL